MKMVLAKRYGFKKRAKLPDAQVNEAIRSLHGEVASELAARRHAPDALGDANPSGQPTSRV